MDNIMTGLESKAAEITQLQNDVDALIKDSDKFKDSVTQFEELRKKANELKSTLKKKRKHYNDFVDYLKEMDTHYLDVKFPLFKEHQTENVRTWVDENQSSVDSGQSATSAKGEIVNSSNAVVN